MQGTTLETQIW